MSSNEFVANQGTANGSYISKDSGGFAIDKQGEFEDLERPGWFIWAPTVVLYVLIEPLAFSSSVLSVSGSYSPSLLSEAFSETRT